MAMKKKEGQIAAEFVFLIGTALTLVIIFAVAADRQVIDFKNKRDSELLKDITFKTQTEISIAARVEDGYYRVFALPEKLENSLNYTIVMNDTMVIAESVNSQYIFFTPKVNGSLKKGNNTIKKVGGVIYLNQ